jgi:hypothetical protein
MSGTADLWNVGLVAVRTMLALAAVLFGLELLLPGDLWVAVVALLMAVGQLLVAMGLWYGDLLIRVAFVLVGVGALLVGLNFLESDFMLVGIACLVAGVLVTADGIVRLSGWRAHVWFLLLIGLVALPLWVKMLAQGFWLLGVGMGMMRSAGVALLSR